MQSQVSFKFDGEHNKKSVINILKNNLRGLKYKIECEGNNVFRVYVASLESKEETYKVCYGIQCFCVYDNTKKL